MVLLHIFLFLSFVVSLEALQTLLTFSKDGQSTSRGDLQMPRDFNPYGKNGGEISMPAGLSRDIVPLPVHSHNDYWREIPLFTALSYGVTSIEADVWLNPKDGKLYVSHDIYSLTRERTFRKLYVEPLFDLVRRANPEDDEVDFFDQTNFMFPDNTVEERRPWNSYWMSESTLSTQLLVDVKTHGNDTLAAIKREIAPLAERGWLTYYNGTHIIPGPVTVVLTGNGNNKDVRSYLATQHERDVFIDAPLLNLDQTWTGIDGQTYTWNSTLSPLASTSYSSATRWKGQSDIDDASKSQLSHLIEKAHARGIKTRFWSSPRWPASARERVWATLYSLGSDYIDADDLKEIAQHF